MKLFFAGTTHAGPSRVGEKIRVTINRPISLVETQGKTENCEMWPTLGAYLETHKGAPEYAHI
jgi:hypothetical protein